jgi:asparagine synthase (glutamine-hydrolysing)
VDDPKLDEATAAAATAAHFNTEHHEFKINAETAAAAFPDYLADMDVPSVDGFNTWLVSRCARSKGMKVVLSGLGGDELLAGYNTFLQVPKLISLGRKLTWLGPLKSLMGMVICLLGKSSKWQRLGEFLQGAPNLERAYAATRGVFSTKQAFFLAKHFSEDYPEPIPASALPNNVLDAVSELELTRYMRNQLLRDSDVMSMAHGLELRVPLVDATLFNSLAELPASIRLQQGKKLLLQAVPEVPAAIANAPKRGFSFPFAQWLATSFGERFSTACQGLPVTAYEWYQEWTLFVFQDWCRKMDVRLPTEK